MRFIFSVLLTIIFLSLLTVPFRVAEAADPCGDKCKPWQTCSGELCVPKKCDMVKVDCQYKANNTTYEKGSGYQNCTQFRDNEGKCALLPDCSTPCNPLCDANRNQTVCKNGILYGVSDCDLRFGDKTGDIKGKCTAERSDLGPGASGLPQLQQLVLRVINISVGLVFIAVTIMLVWGGFKYIVSGGEPKSLQGANSTITWALLGVLFLVLAWLGLQLLAKFTGIDYIGNFCLGFKPYCALELK